MGINFNEERERIRDRYSYRQDSIRRRVYTGIILGATLAVSSLSDDSAEGDNFASAYEGNRITQNETSLRNLPTFLLGLLGMLYFIKKADDLSNDNERIRLEESKRLKQRRIDTK